MDRQRDRHHQTCYLPVTQPIKKKLLPKRGNSTPKISPLFRGNSRLKRVFCMRTSHWTTIHRFILLRLGSTSAHLSTIVNTYLISLFGLIQD